ncbi:MAG: four helix bundle protein [Bacteroidota bacterium]|nr:four helix bundle protein [Bacteroidota bacterium]
MRNAKHKDLKVWDKVHFYILRVYEAYMSFPKEEMYSLSNYLRRSASSLPAAMAEGCGKKSKQELVHF